MPRPNLTDFATILDNENMGPLFDLAWGAFKVPTEDAVVKSPAEAREALELYTQGEVDDLIDKLYPIGSIYFCVAATDPNSVLPGTWTLLTEGKFLVSAGGSGDYVLGSTGGLQKVTLTEANMPSHAHSYSDAQVVGAGTKIIGGGTTFGVVDTNRQTVESGGDVPHENRPPFYAVNMWYRTA